MFNSIIPEGPEINSNFPTKMFANIHYGVMNFVIRRVRRIREN